MGEIRPKTCEGVGITSTVGGWLVFIANRATSVRCAKVDWLLSLSATISLALLEECNSDASNIVAAHGYGRNPLSLERTS